MSRGTVRVTIPRGSTPALMGLTVVNLVVFGLWQVALTLGGPLPDLMATFFTTSDTLVMSGFVWTLLGSAFSHLSPPHLFLNMLALWVFGRDVERVVGTRGMLHLYVAGGILASLGHVAYNLATGVTVPALGASGSVMAIAVVSALLFPNRLLLVMFILPMRQITAVGLFILLDLFGMISPGADTVAHAAHLGGALYGWLYYRRQLAHYLAAQIAQWRQARHLDPEDVSRWNHPVA